MTLSAASPHRINHAVVLEGSETIGFASLTAEAYSTVLEAKGFASETFYLKNTSDQALTVQLQASPDGLAASDWHDVGNSVSLGVGNATATLGLVAVTDAYHPFYRLKITRGITAPTVGSLTIKARGQSGY